MKSILKSIFLLVFVFTFSSCGGDDEPEQATYFLHADIDGASFDASSNLLNATKFVEFTGTRLTISASATNLKTLTLSVNNYTGVGTYDITGTLTRFDENADNTWFVMSTGTGNTVTISEVNDTDVTGTFSFRAKLDSSTATKLFTGSFKVKFL